MAKTWDFFFTRSLLLTTLSCITLGSPVPPAHWRAHSQAIFPGRTNAAGFTNAGVATLAGGAGPQNTYFNDVWSLAGVGWTQQTSTARFSARSGLEGKYFLAAQKMIICGGQTGRTTFLNDVWSSVDGVTWSTATSAANFGPRHSLAMFESGNKLFIAGGQQTFSSYFNDVWSTTDGVTWLKVVDAAPWPSRVGATVASFGAFNFLMAGLGDDGLMADVWVTSDGLTWANRTATRTFLPRQQASAVAVLTASSQPAQTGNIYLYGGLTKGEFANDIWAASVQDTTQSVVFDLVTSEASWPGRAGQVSAFDSTRQAVVLASGATGPVPYTNDWYDAAMTPSTVAPTIAPNGGDFDDSVTVTMSADTPTPSTIYYTTDGSEPTSYGNGIEYKGPVKLAAKQSGEFVVKAVAVQGALQDSAVVATDQFQLTISAAPSVEPFLAFLAATVAVASALL